MATHKTAEKRNRQTQKRQLRNNSVRSSEKTAVKKAREAFAAKDPAKAQQALKEATRALAKASTKGVVHAKNASRRIGRLAKQAAALRA